VNYFAFPANVETKPDEAVHFKTYGTLTCNWYDDAGNSLVTSIVSVNDDELGKKCTNALILYCCGNDEQITSRYVYEKLSHINAAFHIPVFSFEYPSCGWSRHQRTTQKEETRAESFMRWIRWLPNDVSLPSEKRLYKLSFAVLCRLRNQYPNRQIILWGRSIGSAPACRLIQTSHRSHIAGLILESPLASLQRLLYAGRWFLSSHTPEPDNHYFDNEEAIRICDKGWPPTFIVHGKKDRTIPCSHSEYLHKLIGSQSTLVLVDNKAHDTLYLVNDFIDPLRQWIEGTRASISL